MHMNYLLLVVILLMPVCASISEVCPNLKNDVRSIRKRRYLMFPEGSDAVLTLDFAKTFMTHVPSGWYMALDLDVIFSLPGKELIRAHLRRKLHHRQKREFWDRVKNALNLHNMNGHACVLRSICEAKTYLAPPGKSLVHDLLRVIFTAHIEEKEFSEEIGEAYRELADPDFCDQVHECPFSLLHFILAFNKKKK